MSDGIRVQIEWLDAPGVTTSELAATWARYEIWINDRCLTAVETADGNVRRSVYGSLYPIAEWIASNWWVLGHDLRPSAVEGRYWSWGNVRIQPWLRDHNLRGAGDGMAWPDLTVVPEGNSIRLRWVPDRHGVAGGVRFLTGGDTRVSSSGMTKSLAEVVNRVIERLKESQIYKTRLSEEWTAIAATDPDEAEFCRTAAQLGLDPYSLDDETADRILTIADQLPYELHRDFFDTADPDALAAAANWTSLAVSAATDAASRASRGVDVLREAVSDVPVNRTTDRPWLAGYALAQRVRQSLRLSPVARFNPSPWIGSGSVQAASAGVQGTAVVSHGKCGVVLAHGGASAFSRARALGRTVARTDQRVFVLSRAGGFDERVARAFAAEVLAPAAGIRTRLDELGSDDDTALEAVAQEFGVSPLVVRHQYDNQLATAYE